MKSKFVRILSVFFCIAMIFTAVCLTRIEIRGANSATLLFLNDRVWTQNYSLPAEQLYSVYYAPISLFVQLPSVDVRINNTLKTFIITYGEKFLSFDMSTNFAANHNRERMYLKTMEYHDERYVPIEAVCQALGLGCEIYVDPTTSSVAIRVTDGAQTKTLESLAKSNYPGYFPETTEQTTTPKDTTAKDTSKDTTEKDTAPVLSDRTIYITIDASTGEYTNDILSVLGEYDCRATFFISEDVLQSMGPNISAIAAGGHAIALRAENLDAAAHADFDTMLSDVERQNKLLERFIKQKSHIIHAPSSISDETVELFKEHGYLIWTPNVRIDPKLSVSSASYHAINGIWNNEIAVLRFTDSKNTAAALEKVLKFISQNSTACEVRVISAALEN